LSIESKLGGQSTIKQPNGLSAATPETQIIRFFVSATGKMRGSK
jgi:hypothetical protein